MNAYDRWLEAPYQSSRGEVDEDSRQEFCQNEYLTDEELLSLVGELPGLRGILISWIAKSVRQPEGK